MQSTSGLKRCGLAGSSTATGERGGAHLSGRRYRPLGTSAVLSSHSTWRSTDRLILKGSPGSSTARRVRHVALV